MPYLSLQDSITSEVQRSWELLSLVADFPAKKSFRYLMDLVCFSYGVLLQSHFCISVLRQGNIMPPDLSTALPSVGCFLSALAEKAVLYMHSCLQRCLNSSVKNFTTAKALQAAGFLKKYRFITPCHCHCKTWIFRPALKENLSLLMKS